MKKRKEHEETRGKSSKSTTREQRSFWFALIARRKRHFECKIPRNMCSMNSPVGDEVNIVCNLRSQASRHRPKASHFVAHHSRVSWHYNSSGRRLCSFCHLPFFSTKSWIIYRQIQPKSIHSTERSAKTNNKNDESQIEFDENRWWEWTNDGLDVNVGAANWICVFGVSRRFRRLLLFILCNIFTSAACIWRVMERRRQRKVIERHFEIEHFSKIEFLCLFYIWIFAWKKLCSIGRWVKCICRLRHCIFLGVGVHINRRLCHRRLSSFAFFCFKNQFNRWRRQRRRRRANRNKLSEILENEFDPSPNDKPKINIRLAVDNEFGFVCMCEPMVACSCACMCVCGKR